MEIRKAEPDQFQEIRAFYHSVIDGIAESSCRSVGWKKDIYPNPTFLMDSIENGELYVGTDVGEIIASMVANHCCNDSYWEFNWPTEAEDDEVTVIHALCVHPSQIGRKRWCSMP